MAVVAGSEFSAHTQTYDLSVSTSGSSAWVSISRSVATKLMALEIASGGPSATITIKTRPIGDTGSGSLVKSAGDTGEDLSLTTTSAGGTIGSAQLAPLAALINREWQLVFSANPSSSLAVTLHIS